MAESKPFKPRQLTEAQWFWFLAFIGLSHPRPHAPVRDGRDHRWGAQPHLFLPRSGPHPPVHHPSRVPRPFMAGGAFGFSGLALGKGPVRPRRAAFPGSLVEIFQALGADGNGRDYLLHGPFFAPALAVVPESHARHPFPRGLLVVPGTLDGGLCQKKRGSLVGGLFRRSGRRPDPARGHPFASLDFGFGAKDLSESRGWKRAAGSMAVVLGPPRFIFRAKSS